MYDLNYVNWKAWNSTENNRTAKAYFREIARLSKMDFSSEVLEVGFGNANFLEFGSTHFKKIIGVEANDYLVTKFKDRYEVYGVDYIDNSTKLFDSIVLFDVLEHIEQDQLINFIGALVKLLKPNGVIVARFPNGDSPFSCINYNSDLTHRICIGSGIINFISQKFNLKINYAGAYPSPILGCKFLTALHRSFVKVTFTVIDFLFKFLYMRWNGYSITSINALVILSK